MSVGGVMVFNPLPGGPGELCDWAGDFYSHPVDRTRPLREMVLIDGLEHGRWALAHKTHHCLVDGVGSVDVARVLLDPEPDPNPPASAIQPPAKPPKLLRAALGWSRRRARVLGRSQRRLTLRTCRSWPPPPGSSARELPPLLV